VGRKDKVVAGGNCTDRSSFDRGGPYCSTWASCRKHIPPLLRICPRERPRHCSFHSATICGPILTPQRANAAHPASITWSGAAPLVRDTPALLKSVCRMSCKPALLPGAAQAERLQADAVFIRTKHRATRLQAAVFTRDQAERIHGKPLACASNRTSLGGVQGWPIPGYSWPPHRGSLHRIRRSWATS